MTMSYKRRTPGLEQHPLLGGLGFSQSRRDNVVLDIYTKGNSDITKNISKNHQPIKGKRRGKIQNQ